jgi:tetratricopeptide (TPR) repeat protein
MNRNVTQRYVKLSAICLVIFGLGWLAVEYFLIAPAPGDFDVKAGNIHLNIKEYDKALEDYDLALKKQPNHRGALMGRAITLHLAKRHDEAHEAYTYLIDYLTKNLKPDDKTGRAVLAGAYANRGIMKDQTGRHKQALADYIAALKVDPGAVAGPGFVHKILYLPNPSSVRKRAEYLIKQFKLPKDKRVFRVPEIDAEQRMHTP